MDYLVFRLYGAMASWGEIAVGESRHSATHPSKSALLGLIAAAMGIKRDEEEKQVVLSSGYRFAVKLLSSGDFLRDYHTTQVPDSVGKFSYRTRRDELVQGQDRLGTNLSTREYRTDSVAIVALYALADAPYSLSEIQDALLRPAFHLYQGRKSCPLAAPLAPAIIENQAGFMAALNAYEMKPILPLKKGQMCRENAYLSIEGLQQYYWEGVLADFAENSDHFDESRVQTFTRHDQPRSRKRWQFSQRLEHFYQSEPQATMQAGEEA